MAQDVQLQNAMRERNNFLEHMRALFSRFLQSLKDKETPRVKLMRELCGLIESNPDQVASALIPSTRAQLMEDFLCAKNIPHAQISAQNGMTMFVFDGARTAEINRFDRQCMKLGQGGQKIVSTHDMMDVFRTTNNNVMATLNTQNMNDFTKEAILTKLYAAGKGYNVCETNGYQKINSVGTPIGTSMYGMEIGAVCNSDINQPDLVQAGIEVMIAENNTGKTFLKALNETIDTNELDKFAEAIKYKNSVFLCDRYNSNRSCFEYNAKDNCVYKHDNITGDKIRVLDAEDFKEMKLSDKGFDKSLRIRLAGLSDQVFNMKTASLEEKAILDAKTPAENNALRNSSLYKAGSKTFDILSKTEDLVKELGIEFDNTDVLDLLEIDKIPLDHPDLSEKGKALCKEVAELKSEVTSHVDYNNKAFLSGIEDRIKDTGKVPDTIRDMILLNTAEDLSASLVSDYMAEYLTRDINSDQTLNTERALNALKVETMDTPNLFDKAFTKEAILAKIKESSPVLANQMETVIDEEALSRYHASFQAKVASFVDCIEIREVDEFEKIVDKSDAVEKEYKANKAEKENDKTSEVEAEKIEKETV